METKLERISQLSRENPNMVFTSIVNQWGQVWWLFYCVLGLITVPLALLFFSKGIEK